MGDRSVATSAQVSLQGGGGAGRAAGEALDQVSSCMTILAVVQVHAGHSAQQVPAGCNFNHLNPGEVTSGSEPTCPRASALLKPKSATDAIRPSGSWGSAMWHRAGQGRQPMHMAG